MERITCLPAIHLYVVNTHVNNQTYSDLSLVPISHPSQAMFYSDHLQG